jgi:steroid 5-alpha reductase family enzyme
MIETIYRLRGPLVAPPILAAAILATQTDADGLVDWPVGVGLFLAGWAIRIWAQRHLRYRLKSRMALATCGPYAHVRNPIYLGNALMGIGAVVASEVSWMIPVAALWYVAVYAGVVQFEERRLKRTYGAPYVAYCEGVPRWWPRIGTTATPCPHRGLRRALLTELHGPLIMAPAALKTLHVALLGWLHAMLLR